MGKNRHKPTLRSPFDQSLTQSHLITRNDFEHWKEDVKEMMQQYLKESDKRDTVQLCNRIDRKLNSLSEAIENTRQCANLFMGRPFIRESEAMRRYSLSSRTFLRFRSSEGLEYFIIGSERCYFIEQLEEFLLNRSVSTLKQVSRQERTTSNSTNNDATTKP